MFVSVDQHINATSQCQQIEAQLKKLLEAIKEPVKVTLGDFDPICSDTGRSFKKKKKTWLVSEATLNSQPGGDAHSLIRRHFHSSSSE